MKISTKQVQPGMITLSDVLASGGNIIAHGNHPITKEQISNLIKYGISSVEIDDKSVSGSFLTDIQKKYDFRVQNLPSISIQLSDDLMSATLVIEPTEPDNSDLLKSDILTILKNQDITVGIDEMEIEAVVKNWNNHKHRYEITNIAKGAHPESGKEGIYQPKVHYLTNENDIKRIKDAKYMWQLPDLIPQIQRVIPDMVIAEQLPCIPSIPGKNIKGELVFTNETLKAPLSLGAGLSFSQDGPKIISKLEGVVYYTKTFIDVVHINFDGAVELVISPDAMKAELIMYSPVDGGVMPDEKQIREKLINENVIFGIKDDKLAELIKSFDKMKISDTPVIIAEGIKPQNGQNGKIIFHFNTETSLKPKENPDGSVDYKSVNIVNSILKGQKLVSLGAPSTGTPGKNVFCETIACQDGTPAKLPMGPNTEPDPNDPEILIASIDGVVRYNGSVVEINEGFMIKGNVDFSTGNVKYERSVLVNGDIKSGFEIDCGGDIQVGGTIEDCTLLVGGNVLCRYGFSGQGKGIIDAKGDVNLGFMKNQTVRSRKNVNIAREAINSTIFAKNVIHIHGNPLSAAGGYLTAKDSIIVNSVGNHSGIRTLLEVGFDFTLSENLKSINDKCELLVDDQNKIIENLKKIENISSIQRKLSLKDQILKTKLIESLHKYKQQIEFMEMQKKMILKKMYAFENATIKFERSAFPGTLFKFGERHFLVKEEITGPKTVRFVDHEIRVL